MTINNVFFKWIGLDVAVAKNCDNNLIKTTNSDKILSDHAFSSFQTTHIIQLNNDAIKPRHLEKRLSGGQDDAWQVVGNRGNRLLFLIGRSYSTPTPILYCVWRKTV